MSEYVLTSCKALDYVIRGEGEIPFYQLVNFKLNRNGNLEQIGGLAYLTNQGYLENASARNREPDSIPWPAWDLVPINNYLDHGISMFSSDGFRCIPIISPISETKSIYLNTLKSNSSSWLYRTLCYLGFHTLIMNGLHEDKKWLKSIYPNFKKGRKINLCDHDFHLKKYLKKFIVKPKSIK